jgi:hypothetical protein
VIFGVIFGVMFGVIFGGCARKRSDVSSVPP